MAVKIRKRSNTLGKPAMFGETRRILAVTCGTLLDQGVLKLLSQHPNLEVWDVRCNNERTLTRVITQKAPDVLLLFHSTPDQQERLLETLDSLSALEKLRIIMMDLHSNMLHVYYKKGWVMAESSAFFSLINDAYFIMQDDFARQQNVFARQSFVRQMQSA